MFVVDGHNDTLLDIHGGRSGERSFLERSAEGHLDLPRAREGGFAAGLFAAFVPNSAADGEFEFDIESDELPPAIDGDVARRETHEMLRQLHAWADAADEFRIVRDGADLRACLAGETVGAIPHIEGAAAVRPDCSNLPELVAAGVRSVGLVWSRPNAFGHGVPFRHDASPDTGPELTDAGERLVRECNDRGVVVDCAHLNERGFRDVRAETADPLVVSHTAAHAICPATRNLTDEQIRAVADSGGLVGLTFACPHLRPDGENDADTPLSTLCDHVDHLVDVAGIDHVAFGSDFDGATVPDELGDVAGYPRLLAALEARGYDERERRKLAHENWVRVLTETWG